MADEPWTQGYSGPLKRDDAGSARAMLRVKTKGGKKVSLRDNPSLAVARREPGFGDYASAVAGSLKRAPEGTMRVARVLPTLASAGAEYLRTHTPREVASAAADLGSRAIAHAKEHPIGTLSDLTPFVGDAKGIAQSIEEAARRRARGDLAGAHDIESLTVPMAAIGFLPEAGAAAVTGVRALRRAVPAEIADVAAQATGRPRFNVSEQGPYLHVSREGVEPQIVPEVADAKDINALRVIMRDKERNPALRLANQQSLATRGVPLRPDEPMPTTSLQKQSGIARVFDTALQGSPEYKNAIFEAYGNAMPREVEKSGAQNYDQLMEAAYRALGEHGTQQFDRLPIEMRYHYGEGEYPTPSAMFRDVLAKGRLNVFRGGDPHDFLNRIDPVTGLSENEKFRAVHDYLGHVAPGSTFRPGGEEIAYATHARTLPPLAQAALLSETRGQNSFVNYGPLNADLLSRMKPLQDKISELQRMDDMRGRPGASAPQIAEINRQLRELGGETQFAPQKSVLLPPEYLDPMSPGGVPDYLRGIIQPKYGTAPERAVHLSHTEGLTATDPAMYGTGHRGRDWAIKGWKGSPAEKTSFYLGPEGTVRPEKMVADVSPYAYDTSVSNLYDIAQDPDQLVKLARAHNLEARRMGRENAHLPDLMRMVQEGGYSGVRNPDFLPGQGAADIFQPVGDLRAITKGPEGYAKGGLAVRRCA